MQTQSQYLSLPPGLPIYDEEHEEGVGGFHHTEEDGSVTWIECITESKPGAAPSRPRFTASTLRSLGEDVAPFTGTPCVRCFAGR